jgi:hypothetical protein
LACRIFNPKTPLTNKFARRFVMVGPVIIGVTHRYVGRDGARRRDDFLSRELSACTWETQKMQKTILTILASSLLAASTVQIAAAAEYHRSHKLYRTHAPVNEDIRNSNAYYAPTYASPWTQPDWSDYSRYQNGAGSALAGH